MIIFQVLLNFDPVKEITKNTMSHLHFNKESDYSVENTCKKNEVFRSTILPPFQFEPEQKIRVVMRAMRKKLNMITLQVPSYCVLG